MNDPVMMELNELSDMLLQCLKEAPVFDLNLKGNKDLDTLICNWSHCTHRDYEDTHKCNTEMQERFFCYFDNLEGKLDETTNNLYSEYRSKLLVRKRFTNPIS